MFIICRPHTQLEDRRVETWQKDAKGKKERKKARKKKNLKSYCKSSNDED